MHRVSRLFIEYLGERRNGAQCGTLLLIVRHHRSFFGRGVAAVDRQIQSDQPRRVALVRQANVLGFSDYNRSPSPATPDRYV